MKAILLHGTDGSSQSNWLPWLSQQLATKGWQVWVPDLPEASAPNTARYNAYFRDEMPWSLDSETVLVGHSSGSLAALGLLQDNPGARIGLCVLVAGFKDDLGWSALSGLFDQPYDFEAIKTRSGNFTLFHSDDDPYCPLDHAEFLAAMLGGELIVQPGRGHFNLESSPPCDTFVDLLRHIEAWWAKSG